LFANENYSVIPFRTCTDKFSKLPFCVNNPLNLINKEKLETIFFVSPIKFFIPEINSGGCSLVLGLPFGLRGSVSMEYLNAKKFFTSDFMFSVQRKLFDKFNFANAFSINLTSIENFGKRWNFQSNVFLEYSPFNEISVSFASINIFVLNKLQNQIHSFGIQYFDASHIIGTSINVCYKNFTSYSFYISFCPLENFSCGVDLRTNPQTLTLSFGYDFDEIEVFMFFQYNNTLLVSQTFCFSMKL
ncbi:MAG: hypothetical protein N2560_06110, partial [Ignavibacteria bacterium]|nr:hypothetical protein [Ignavibacteria bacterium]